MESYATKKMPFKFSMGEEEAEAESPMKETAEGEAATKTPEELGAAVKAAIESGDGMAICEAIKAVVAEYEAG